MGKTGTLTPVAFFKPVVIAGSTISKASLHNIDEIERLGIQIGDWVVVEKAGKVIPHVVRVELHRRDGTQRPFKFPKRCPECDSPVVRDEDGVYIRCRIRTARPSSGRACTTSPPVRDGCRRIGDQADRAAHRSRVRQKASRRLPPEGSP